MDSLSENSTLDSSFQSQVQLHSRDSIESSVTLMQRVVAPRLKLGMEQIVHHYLDQTPERIHKVIQKAERDLSNKMYQNCAHASRMALNYARKANKLFQIQAAILVLAQSLICLQEVVESEALISTISTINLLRSETNNLKILILSIKIATLNRNQIKLMNQLEDLKSLYIQRREMSINEKVELVTLYVNSLLHLSRWDMAERVLRQWMSIFANDKNVSNLQLTQFYLLLAKCARQSGNLNHEYCHLCCAQSSILTAPGGEKLKTQIRLQKISNLIDRNLINRAIEELIKITDLVPKKVQTQESYLKELKEIFDKLRKKVQQNTFPISLQKKYCFNL